MMRSMLDARILWVLPLMGGLTAVEARPLEPPVPLPVPAGATPETASRYADAAHTKAGPPPQPSSPDAAPALLLDDLLTKLLARNPEIAARAALRDAELTRERRAWALPDPTLQIMGENFPLGSRMPAAGMDESSSTVAPPPMIAYQLSQMFMFPGKRALMAREAAAGLDMARADLELSRQDLIAAGRRMFFELHLNAQARRINLVNQQLVEQLRQLTLTRYGAGLEAHHDVLRAQVELQSLEYERLTLEQQRQSMAALLNAWLNQAIETPLPEPDVQFATVRKLDPATLEPLALEQRPELQRMAAMVEQEEAMVAAARRNYFPDFMVMGTYQQMIGDMGAWGGAVSVSLPIWLGKKQALEVIEQQRRGEAARQSLEAMRALVRFEVQDARLKVETAERRIRLLEQMLLPKAEEALSSLMASYRTGRLDFISLLESRRTLQDLQLELERARVEREQRLADLDRAIGATLQRTTP